MSFAEQAVVSFLVTAVLTSLAIIVAYFWDSLPGVSLSETDLHFIAAVENSFGLINSTPFHSGRPKESVTRILWNGFYYL
jgi:hypothetical protein